MIEIPASHRDLLENSQVAILGTGEQEGVPQGTATWFLVDDDGTVRLSLNTARQKVKNLQRHPEASLFFLDLAHPYRTLEVRAQATIEPDPDYPFADRIGARYGGANRREMDQAGEQPVVIRFEPVTVNTFG